MFDRALRRFVCVLSCVAVIALAILPPEHVHEHATTANGHHGELVHRHLAPHHHGAPGADDDDGPALWLDAPYRVTVRAPMPAPASVMLGAGPLAAELRTDQGQVLFAGALPIHDPPLIRPRDFRGPPVVL